VSTYPAVENGQVFVLSEDGTMSQFAAACATNGGTCSAEATWKDRTRAGLAPTPVVRDGVLYVVTDAVRAVRASCVRAGTCSTVLWSTDHARSNTLAAVADEAVYVAQDGGEGARLFAWVPVAPAPSSPGGPWRWLMALVVYGGLGVLAIRWVVERRRRRSHIFA